MEMINPPTKAGAAKLARREMAISIYGLPWGVGVVAVARVAAKASCSKPS